MMWGVRLRSALTVLLLAAGIQVVGQVPHLRKITASRELARKLVQCMFQDHKGFMWLGTDNGLYKYDGINYQPYFLTDTAQTNKVTALHQDAAGTIWVGYQSGMMATVVDEKLRVFQPREGTPVVPITGLATDGLGTLWISTYGEGLYYFRNQRVYNLDEDDGLSGNDIYTLLVDATGKVWIGTDAGISIVAKDSNHTTIETLTHEDGLPDNIIKCLAADDVGNIWISSYDRGICRYNLKRKTIDSLPLPWDHGKVTTMQWGSNRLWMGTESSGLLYYHPFQKELREYSLQGAKILDLLVDQEHNLWVSRNDHQLYWIQPGLSFIRSASDHQLVGITAIAKDDKGSLWYGNEAGLFQYRPDRPLSDPQHIATVSKDILPINCIFPDDHGVVWLGTWNGLYSYHPGSQTIRRWTQAHGLVNNNVLSIAGAGNTVWIATLGGVSRLLQDDGDIRFESFDNEALLGAGYVYHVFVDDEQNAWFGTDGRGLINWKDQKFTSLEERQPEGSKVIYSIVEDPWKNIWFSTPANGLYKFDGNNFIHFGLNEGLRELEINALAINSQGNVLMAHSRGLDFMNPRTSDIMYFGDESGIEDLEVDLNSITVDQQGVVWIGAKNGIIRFEQWHEAQEMKPSTLIDRTSIFLEPTPLENGSKLRYSQNHVSFEYVGLWYQNPSEVVYQTKLTGFDLDWNLNKGQISTYPKLPPGDYTFMVRSSINGYFDNAKVASLDFSVDAPYYQKVWFISICGLVGALLLIGLVRYRENRLRDEERLKKELVQTQLETLKSQVNPHFLFNSFNTLAGIIEDDKDSAVDYVERLSDFFRASLAFRDRALITLEEELEMIRNYYFLQRKRYGDNLKVTLEVEPRILKKLIPPLTLQMLAENAIKHNIASKEKPLLVRIFNEGEYLYVSNNKQMKQYREDSTGFGLFGIITRYKLITAKTVIINDQVPDFYEVGVPLLEEPTI